MHKGYHQDIESIAAYLEQVEGALILIAVTDDAQTRKHAARALKQRLGSQWRIRKFNYDVGNLSLFEGLQGLPISQRSVVLAVGLDQLPRDKRTEAIKLLNAQRNRLGQLDLPIVLWIDASTLTEVSHLAADFYSWRSKTIFLSFPKQSQTVREDRKNYLHAIRQQDEYIDLQGLAPTRGGTVVQIRLDDVFVPMRIEPLPATDSLPTSDDVVRVASRQDSKPKTSDFSLSVVLESERLIILGDPGAGKSTLLKHLQFQLCKSNSRPPSPHGTKFLLPVYLRVAEYAQRMRTDDKLSLTAFALADSKRRGLPLTSALLQTAIDSGTALFLLDGLDEVADTRAAQRILDSVEHFLSRYPKTKIVITSRPVSFQYLRVAETFSRFAIAPLQLDQIERFSRNWYAAFGRPDAGTELYHSIRRHASVQQLASNPLLLTVIAMMHWRGTQLPTHRARLYRVAAETLVDQWMSYRRITPEGWRVDETLNSLLPEIAWRLHTNKLNGLIDENELHDLLVATLKHSDPRMPHSESERSASRFITNVSRFSGILVERGIDDSGKRLFGFLHLTFQEYFAGTKLAEQWQRDHTLPFGLLHKPEWQEVFRLASGYLGEFSHFLATEFVRSLVDAPNKYEKVLHRGLLLGAYCMVDDVPISFELQRQITTDIIKLYFSGRTPSAFKTNVREVIYGRFNSRFGRELEAGGMMRLGHDIARVRSDAIRIIGWLYYGGLGSWALTRQLLKLKGDAHERVRTDALLAATLVAPLADEKKIIQPIIRLLSDESYLVRVAAVNALALLSEEHHTTILSRVKPLLSSKSPETRAAACMVVSELVSSPETVKFEGLLVGNLINDNLSVRVQASTALARLSTRTRLKHLPAQLPRLLSHPDLGVVMTTVDMLALLQKDLLGPKFFLMIETNLRSSDADKLVIAIRAITAIGPSAATPEIVSSVRNFALSPYDFLAIDGLEALAHMGKLKDHQTVARLKEIENNQTEIVLSSLARALKAIVPEIPEMVTTIPRLIDSSFPKVRVKALETVSALGEKAGHPDVLGALISAIASQKTEVVVEGLEALSATKHHAARPEVLSEIIAKLTSRNRKIRKAALASAVKLFPYVERFDRPRIESQLNTLAAANSNSELLEARYIGLGTLLT